MLTVRGTNETAFERWAMGSRSVEYMLRRGEYGVRTTPGDRGILMTQTRPGR